MNCKKCGAIIENGKFICSKCNTPVDIKVSVPKENRKVKNTGSIKIFLIVIGIAILFVLGYFCFYVKAPDVIFKEKINNLYSLFINENNNEDTYSIDYSYKLNLESDNEYYKEIFKLINDMTFNLNVEADNINKIVNMNIKTKYQEKDFLDIDLNVADKKTYIYLNNIYDKYINISSEEINTVTTSIDTKTFISEMKNAFFDALKEEYFTKEKAKIKVNNKELSVTKNILTIDKSNKNAIISDIKDYINNSEKLESVIPKVFNMNKNDFINSIEETVSDEAVTITVYTGIINEFVGISIESNIKIDAVIDNNICYFTLTNGETIYNATLEYEKESDKQNITISTEIDSVKIKVIMCFKEKYNVKVDQKIPVNTISIEDLTDEDVNTIINKFMENEQIKEITGRIQDLMQII